MCLSVYGKMPAHPIIENTGKLPCFEVPFPPKHIYEYYRNEHYKTFTQFFDSLFPPRKPLFSMLPAFSRFKAGRFIFHTRLNLFFATPFRCSFA